MKITCILKDKSNSFFETIAVMSDAERLTHLMTLAPLNMGVSVKINDNSFRARVELNQLLRKQCAYSYKLEARRGYMLATFEVSQL